ncbi:MAG: hypothetical protein KGO05_03410 [Chloroflexota bacterium]|nr:hypothetical protein [Chloroflexota bacterium]
MRSIVRRGISVQMLSLYLLFVIPVLLGGVGLYIFQRDTLRDTAFQSDQGLAQAVALDIGAHVQAASEIDRELATNRAVSSLDFAQLNTIFAYSFGAHPDITLYYIIDPRGSVIFTYPNTQTSASDTTTYRMLFQRALDSAAPFVSSRRISPLTNADVFSVATPIKDRTGRVVGVMAINISLDTLNLHLQAIQRQLSPASEVGIWIINTSGQTVATTKLDPTSPYLPDLPGGVAAVAQRDGTGNLSSRQQNRDWLYSFVPIPEANWLVVVQRPADVTFAIVTEFERGLFLALALVIVGATFFWFMTHLWIIAPLTRLASAVSLFHPDNPGLEEPTTLLARDHRRPDEIGKLVAAFLEMEKQTRTQLIRSDETIQTQYHTLEAIMRSMDEGVLLESPAGAVVYANPIFCAAVGVPQPELQARTIQDERLRERLIAMLGSLEAYHEVFESSGNGHTGHSVEFQLLGTYRNRGRFVPVRRDMRMRVFYVRDASGRQIGRGKLFQDITVEHQAERIKRNLLAIVSHELRTPLTAIKGYATGLLDEAGGEIDVSWQRHSLGQIVTESNHLADLVTSLLDMSQVEAGTLKLYPEYYLLSALAEEAVALAFAPDARERVRVDLPESLPLLNVDARRIIVVLRNILENARRYGGPDLRIELTAAHESAADPALAGLTIRIADNGPGIPPELTERIFDRFYQVEYGHERSRNGVGLGLAICRGFMEAHHGRVWATNRTDGASGAVFHLWFPETALHVPTPV